MRHIISVLMENESGALSRVAGLFTARGYNIETLSVAPTDDPSISRMTLITSGTDEVVQQITKQLNKLVDVIKLIDLTEFMHIEREMMLIKVKADVNALRNEVRSLAEVFRGHIIDVTSTTYTIELTGTSDKLSAFVRALPMSSVLEVVRSGPLGITRGEKAL